MAPREARKPDGLVVDDGVLDVDEEEELVPATFAITSFGADFLVDGLVTRLRQGDIRVPTFDPDIESASGVRGFQRDFAWTKRQMDRFIESLLLGLPVPGIFLVSEPDNSLLVLDGQQRLRTLARYYTPPAESREKYRLVHVHKQFRGLSYDELDPEDRRRLDNSIIHATIVREDDPDGRFASIYTIFERLNTGGTTLKPQEIRVALYNGNFVTLLRDLNMNGDWRELYGPKSKQMKDQELILRFFAFFYAGDSYRAPMKDFLNGFMASRVNLDEALHESHSGLFAETVSILRQALGPRAFRIGKQVNAAVLDSVMVAVATNVIGRDRTPESVRATYKVLIADPDYLAAVQKATANEEQVKLRFALAHRAFTQA